MSTSAPNRLQNLQSLRIADIDGALATAFAALVTGAFMTGFIARLGAGDQWINLAGALPALLGVMQIPGAVFGRRFRSYKRFVGPGGFLWRLFYVPLAFLPLLAMPSDLKLVVLMVCISLAAASTFFVAPIYNEWLAEMIPPSSRGFYFARRNALLSATGAIAGLLGGFILDFFRLQGKEDVGFTVVFGLGSLFAAGSMFFYLRMADLHRAALPTETLAQAFAGLKTPFVDKRFRLVVLFLGLFVFGQALPGNLFAAFAIKSLHLPYSILQWCGAMHALGNVLAARFWGYLGDKYGNKPILWIVGVLLTVTPTMWLFCEPDQNVRNALILLPIHILVGAVWSGVALCQFNIVLATAKPEERANYLAVTQTIQSTVGFVAPMAGAAILPFALQSFSQEDAYKVVFGATMAARLFSMFFLLPVREAGASKVAVALRDLTRLTPSGIRAMRSLKAHDVDERAQAIEGVGQAGATLAVGEVVKALHDPSPRIRRRAAVALARLDEPEAASALAEQVIHHPDLVEEETVDALGLIGGPDFVPPLVQLLSSPRPMLRRAAAKALARIGDASAVPPLVAVASNPDDPDLQRAALQALRILGAAEAEPAIAKGLFESEPGVRIAAAEAASELELESLLPALRQSLTAFPDEAASEVAYAIGVVGELEDLPSLLQIAGKMGGVSSRRRCLLGAARLLGVEAEAYRLMLAEGMARDRTLLGSLMPLLKGNKRLRDALTHYSAGNEGEALQTLWPNRRFPELEHFARFPVEESFLVAAAFVAHRE